MSSRNPTTERSASESLGKVGIHHGRARSRNQHGQNMRVHTFSRPHVERGKRPQRPLAVNWLWHWADCRKDHRHRHTAVAVAELVGSTMCRPTERKTRSSGFVADAAQVFAQKLFADLPRKDSRLVTEFALNSSIQTDQTARSQEERAVDTRISCLRAGFVQHVLRFPNRVFRSWTRNSAQSYRSAGWSPG